MSCNCKRSDCEECRKRGLISFASSGAPSLDSKPGSFDEMIMDAVKASMLHGFAICAQIADGVVASYNSPTGQDAAKMVADKIRAKAATVLRGEL